MAIQNEHSQLKRKRDSASGDGEAITSCTVLRARHNGTMRLKARREPPQTEITADLSTVSLDYPSGTMGHSFDGTFDTPRHNLVKPAQLQHLRDIATLDDFKTVFLHLVHCHRTVYVETGSLRQDLTMGNLLFTRSDAGAPLGILHDWDLAKACPADPAPQRGRYCAGAAPFMSLHLLQASPPRHKYWHDLESFIYILLWCAVHLNLDGTMQPQHPLLRGWAEGPWDKIRTVKRMFIPTPKETFGRLFDEVRPAFVPLVPAWIFHLCGLHCQVQCRIWERESDLFFDEDWDHDADTTRIRDMSDEVGEELMTYEHFMECVEKPPRIRPSNNITT